MNPLVGNPLKKGCRHNLSAKIATKSVLADLCMVASPVTPAS